MIAIREAIHSLRPGAEWVLSGNAYKGLDWKDAAQVKPTKQEIDDEIARLQSVAEAEKQRQDAIKADSGFSDILAKFRTMSPSDFATYIDNNVTNLASAKVVLIRMGLMLMLLDRKTGDGSSD